MRNKLISTFSFLLFVGFSFGQNLVLGTIDNSVQGVDNNKLFDILTSITEYHGTTPIELRVILTEGESEKIRGIENRYVTTADLNLQAFDLLTQQHLGSKDLKFTGTGTSRLNSCKDLTKSMRRKKAKIGTWITTLDEGVVNCDLLKNRVEEMMNVANYVQAYLLANNPQCTEGSFELKEKINEAYQKRSCDIEIRKAEALIAIKKYEEAVDHIIRVDPEANCGERLSELVATVNENYQADDNRAYEFYMAYLQNEARTQEQRANLINLILLNKLLDE